MPGSCRKTRGEGPSVPRELQFAQVRAVVCSPITFTGASCLDVVLESPQCGASTMHSLSHVSPDLQPPRPVGRNCLALEAHPTASIRAGKLQTEVGWADPGWKVACGPLPHV